MNLIKWKKERGDIVSGMKKKKKITDPRDIQKLNEDILRKFM